MKLPYSASSSWTTEYALLVICFKHYGQSETLSQYNENEAWKEVNEVKIAYLFVSKLESIVWILHILFGGPSIGKEKLSVECHNPVADTW